eukprot:237320_1
MMIDMDLQVKINDIIKTQMALARNNSTSLEELESILTAKIDKTFESMIVSEEKHGNDDIIMTGDQQTESDTEKRYKTEVGSYLADKSKKSLGELLCMKSYDGDLEFVR